MIKFCPYKTEKLVRLLFPPTLNVANNVAAWLFMKTWWLELSSNYIFTKSLKNSQLVKLLIHNTGRSKVYNLTEKFSGSQLTSKIFQKSNVKSFYDLSRQSYLKICDFYN